ncbi:MAG: SusC/RagA family TonB-linked outer membrane protein [Fulvivirga sp.]
MNKKLLNQLVVMSRNTLMAMSINCIFCLIVYANDVKGQASLRDVQVSISVKDAKITDIFNLISVETGFKFTYNNRIVNLKKRINIRSEDQSLFEVLSEISRSEGLSFRRVNDNIHVAKSPQKKPKPYVVDVNESISITGVIRDPSGEPLPGVSIVVKGTQQGTITDIDGNFSLEVDENAILVISFIGYKTTEIAVDNKSTFDITLKEDVTSLNEVVITATGVRRRVEIGNAIARLDVSEDVKVRPINNVSDLLQGQASGVQILGSGGSTGMGSRIRIRGSNSASLSNEPVIYVDGVLINNQPNSISFETGGQSPSRLNDINPEDIESIEVIKGPSAATLYGSIAANGVIRITTKRGKEGKPRWSVFTEVGQVNDIGDYPKNFEALDASGNPGFNFDAAAGTFVHSTVNSYQPLNDSRTSPFRTGNTFGSGLSVSGGNDVLTYFLSGSYTDNEGVLPVNNLVRKNFRGNFGAQVNDKLKLNLSTGFTSSDLELPLNDNFSLALLAQGLNGRATPDINDGWGEFTPEQLFTIDSRQIINRYTTGIEAEWSAFEGFNLRISGGLDYTNRWDLQFFPTGKAPDFLNYDEGAKFSNRFNEFVYTFDAVASYNLVLSDKLSLRSSAGFQYLQNLTEGTLSTGLQIVAGSSSIAGAANTFSDEQTIEQRTTGVFLEEQLNINEKLFLTGAIRSDRGSAFGASLDAVIYPKFSASWLVSNESFFNVNNNLISSLRLRGAWGASGVQPGTNDALRFFTPIAATVEGGESVTGVTFGSVGNADLQPERSTEIEVGLDASFASDRVGLELTYFNKQTEDALIFRQLPLSLGVGNGRFENLGSVKNSGLEIALNTKVFQTDKVAFNLNFVGSFLDNELIELGNGIEPVIFGQQRHVEGKPLGGYWDEEYTFSDENNDGFIGVDEVQVGEVVYLGSPFATTDISFIPSLSFFNEQLTLRGLLNYRGGQKLYNNTGSWRNGNSNTQELNDPNASLEGQARAVAAKFYGTNAGYIEDASFWRLREVSLTYSLPKKILSPLGFSRVSLTLSGQNLGLWTDYSGLDPEISSVGQANFTTEEFLSQPPVRSWRARLNLTF